MLAPWDINNFGFHLKELIFLSMISRNV